MRPRLLLPLALLCATSAVVVWFKFGPAGTDEARPAAKAVRSESGTPARTSTEQTAAAAAPSVSAFPAAHALPLPSPTVPLAQGDAATTLIDEASEPPAVIPYLDHPSPEIREAALSALLRMGEAAAAPALRAAATRRALPAEARAYDEAADWLELPPSGTARRSAKTAAPAH